jgi:hypothetical protein
MKTKFNRTMFFALLLVAIFALLPISASALDAAAKGEASSALIVDLVAEASNSDANHITTSSAKSPLSKTSDDFGFALLSFAFLLLLAGAAFLVCWIREKLRARITKDFAKRR